MPAVEYPRGDVFVRARLRASGDLVVYLPAAERDVVIRRAAVKAWGHGRIPRTFTSGGKAADLLAHAIVSESERFGGRTEVVRVLVDMQPELAALDWEAIVPVRVVRFVRVPPRVAAWPLSLPLRFLQAGPPDRFALRAFLIGHLLAHHGDIVDDAVVVRGTEIPGIERAARDAEWATADVLHLADFPAVPRDIDPMSTVRADIPGTVGWLGQLTEMLRTRLVVVAGSGSGYGARARTVLTALAQRGGPAAVVVAETAPTIALADFYAGIIHDRPLDEAAPPGFGAIIAGAGREELVRPSHIATALAEPEPVPPEPPAAKWATQMTTELLARELSARRFIDAKHSEFSRRWRGEIRFEDHEREGILPVGEHVRTVREAARLSMPDRITIDPDLPRTVNPELGVVDTLGTIRPVDQQVGALVVGEPAILSLSIGPASDVIRVARTRALLDDVMFLPGEDGVRVTFGITGIDFEVDGDPTQDAWLPRDGVTDAVRFVVTPRRRGVSVLRYCVYVRQTLVQSFKLAATTLGSPAAPLVPRARTIARRLALRERDVGDATWLARLEFSLTVDPFDADDRAERSASIVANDLAGRTIVTVKGPDVFGYVTVPGAVDDFVRNARRALEDAATPPVTGADPQDWLYGYGDDTDENRGKPEILRRDLAIFAEVGWGLYSQLVSRKDREKLNVVLARQPDQIIQVAHTLLPKVIPWALVYDRMYSRNVTADENGNQYDHDVCPAALPGDDGVFPNIACGENDSCLLTATGAGGRRYCPETVVCANRFWGFRHQVELPAQQAMDGAAPAAAVSKVEAGPSIRVGVGLHGGLPFAGTHEGELQSLFTAAPRATALAFREYDSNRVRHALDTQLDLDIVYFYCHAEGTQASAVLRFRIQSDAAPEGRLTPGDFDGAPWNHHPIVILNGCRTAAFSPEALSPFIVTFIRDREASALVATEIAVWEQLARAVAREFMGAFLQGDTAGQALLHARRKMLGVGNPLGLSYTLYGVSDLALSAG